MDNRKKLLILIILPGIILVFIGLLAYLDYEFSPTWDDMFVEAVEGGENNTELLNSVDKHYNIELEYMKAEHRATIATSEYNYKIGSITKTELDDSLKEKEKIYKINIEQLKKSLELRKKYINQEISKNEYQKQIKEIYSITENLKSLYKASDEDLTNSINDLNNE